MESTFGWWRRANDILLCLVIVFAIWSLLSTILICIPVPPHYSLFALANSDPRTFRCLNADAVQNANRGLHIASDLCLLSFPIILLCRLRIPWVRKTLLIFLFLFGLVTVLASIMRNIVVPQTGMDLSCMLPDVLISLLYIYTNSMTLDFRVPLEGIHLGCSRYQLFAYCGFSSVAGAPF
jgi:hypothetical protein